MMILKVMDHRAIMDGRMDRVVLGLSGLNRILFWIWDMIYCHAMIEKEVVSTSALKNYFL